MATVLEIEAFLHDFKQKVKLWGLIFRDDRSKNAQTLLDLEISAAYREKVVCELTVSDYSNGPQKDTLNQGPDMWIFKKDIKGHRIYIKITLGLRDNSPVCISFHT